MKPKRIQRKRTKGWRLPPNTICCTRPGKWGNPFRVGFGHAFAGAPMTKEDVLQLFRTRIHRSDAGYPTDEEIIRELRGKNLACFCPLNEACHVDILLEIANSTPQDGA